ncbi:MAG TPA: glycosyltransferase [Steroidobacteraceae bacterium]|jgi:hopene-associated glycosyltransferase HpnB|nr:glycosyltransferase [Steroidobacteraceae bacterium]
MVYLASLPVLIWLYLALARGGFWRVRRLLSTDVAPLGASARVVAIIPARNEASVIGLAVQSLLAQDFAGELHIVVVDDASTDGTAAMVRTAATQAGALERVTLIRGPGPDPGWSGKVCAMARGVAAAGALRCDYFLFTDADIHHEPDNVARLVANARRLDADLLSSMVQLTVSHAAERWLIPAFVFFFLKLYPPSWIARPGATAGAAGGCMLVRPQALARSGGLAAIRSQIIDDCSLAQSIKRSGGRVCLGLTRRARSLRPYGSAGEIGRMISRTAFNQLRHSWLLLAATLLGLVLTYLLPPLLLLSGSRVAVAAGLAAWTLMSLCYAPMVRFYRLNPLWILTLPAAAAFYAGATFHSAWQYQQGRGGQWKGRAQDSHG